MPLETSTPLSAKLMFRTFSFSRNPSLLIFPFCWMLTIDLARGWQGFSRRGVNLSQDEKEANDESSGIEANFSPGSKIDFFYKSNAVNFLSASKCKKGLDANLTLSWNQWKFLQKEMEILAKRNGNSWKRNGNSYKKKWKFLQKEMEILGKRNGKKWNYSICKRIVKIMFEANCIYGVSFIGWSNPIFPRNQT